LGGGSHAAATAGVGGNCRLELVGAWPCWGVIADLAVLRGKGSSGQRDSLVIAVRDAKLAVIEWDAEQHCLRNGSLHSFEGDPALREACPGNTWGPPGR
jgi:cleavage and polyadenylation specificity factor subunit 1